MGSPFARTGITGYPETHPRIDDDITIQAMWDKRRLAAYIVSNLCFDPVTVRRWISRVRARGVTLPLYVGLAGPVERARLLRMAAKAGASESARFLAGHLEWFLRFGTPGGYSPERLLGRLGPALAAPAPAVEGLHLFTFNQVQQTEQWRQAVLLGPGPLAPPRGLTVRGLRRPGRSPARAGRLFKPLSRAAPRHNRNRYFRCAQPIRAAFRSRPDSNRLL